MLLIRFILLLLLRFLIFTKHLYYSDLKCKIFCAMHFKNHLEKDYIRNYQKNLLKFTKEISS